MQDERFVIVKKAVPVSVQNNARAILIEKDGCISLAGFRSLQLVVCLGNPRRAVSREHIDPKIVLYVVPYYGNVIGRYTFTRIDGESNMDLLKRLYYDNFPDVMPITNPAEQTAETRKGPQSIQDKLDEFVNKSIILTVNRRCEELVDEVAQDYEKELVLGKTYCLTQVLDEKSLAIMQEEFEKVLNPEDIFIDGNKLMLYLTKH